MEAVSLIACLLFAAFVVWLSTHHDLPIVEDDEDEDEDDELEDQWNEDEM